MCEFVLRIINRISYSYSSSVSSVSARVQKRGYILRSWPRILGIAHCQPMFPLSCARRARLFDQHAQHFSTGLC